MSAVLARVRVVKVNTEPYLHIQKGKLLISICSSSPSTYIEKAAAQEQL